jgi:hypothetical protein
MDGKDWLLLIAGGIVFGAMMEQLRRIADQIRELIQEVRGLRLDIRNPDHPVGGACSDVAMMSRRLIGVADTLVEIRDRGIAGN